jgi:hypothetical protein
MSKPGIPIRGYTVYREQTRSPSKAARSKRPLLAEPSLPITSAATGLAIGQVRHYAPSSLASRTGRLEYGRTVRPNAAPPPLENLCRGSCCPVPRGRHVTALTCILPAVLDRHRLAKLSPMSRQRRTYTQPHLYVCSIFVYIS